MNRVVVRSLLVFVMCWFVAVSADAQKPKYVFYIIGDGMGINHVEATNYFLSDNVKDVGNHLLFTQFPYSGYVTTYSASHFITCSAAGGTALATGTKTANNSVGIDDKGIVVNSVLSYAQAIGWKTGVVTTAGINDATPGAFYAHRYRKEANQIAFDAADSGIDFIGGASILKTRKYKDQLDTILFNFRSKGYEILRGADAYKDNNRFSKILMLPDVAYPFAFPYAIDRLENDMHLSNLTSSAINFLYKNNPSGFFLMIEGGEIDHSAHVNDLGAVVREVIDLDKNIELAYKFYQQHPDETLIIVTADHETGGLGLGVKNTTLNIQAIEHQKMSLNRLSGVIRDMKDQSDVSWDDIVQVLKSNLGFWDKLEILPEDEQSLKDIYSATFIKKNIASVNTLYAKDEPLAVEAIRIFNSICQVGWTTKSHTASPVPVYSIGVGAEKFVGRMNNIDIPQKIKELIH